MWIIIDKSLAFNTNHFSAVRMEKLENDGAMIVATITGNLGELGDEDGKGEIVLFVDKEELVEAEYGELVAALGVEGGSFIFGPGSEEEKSEAD